MVELRSGAPGADGLTVMVKLSDAMLPARSETVAVNELSAMSSGPGVQLMTPESGSTVASSGAIVRA